MGSFQRCVRTAMLLLAVAVAMPSCGPSQDPPADIAHYEPRERGGMEALLEGTLVREEGCVYVDDSFGVRWIPIFPNKDLAWHDDELHAGGKEYRLGGPVALTGGESTVDRHQVPETCDGTLSAWLVTWE